MLKAYPEVALGSIKHFGGNTEGGVFGVCPALHALGRVRDERALDGRQADDNRLLDGVLSHLAKRVDTQPEGCEVALLSHKT